MMRIVDIIYSLPDMLIIILLSVVFNETLKPLITGTVLEKLGTNMISMFIVFGLLYWVSMARLIRGQILSTTSTFWQQDASVQRMPESCADIFCRTVCPLSLLRQHFRCRVQFLPKVI